MNNRIKIEVAYALPTQQKIIVLEVDEHTTIQQAINASGILDQFPDIDLSRQSVGVFSMPRALTDEVKAGDRVEIYRPLLIDPKDARRQKARKK